MKTLLSELQGVRREMLGGWKLVNDMIYSLFEWQIGFLILNNWFWIPIGDLTVHLGCSNWYEPPGGTIVKLLVGLNYTAVGLQMCNPCTFINNIALSMSVFYLTGLYLDFFPYLMITSELLWFFFKHFFHFCARKSHAICTDCKGFFQFCNCTVQKAVFGSFWFWRNVFIIFCILWTILIFLVWTFVPRCVMG